MDPMDFDDGVSAAERISRVNARHCQMPLVPHAKDHSGPQWHWSVGGRPEAKGTHIDREEGLGVSRHLEAHIAVLVPCRGPQRTCIVLQHARALRL